MAKKKGKMEKTMHEFKHGTLHSGSKSGPKVKSRKQAIAIGMNQARKAGEGGGSRESGKGRSKSEQARIMKRLDNKPL